jgi:hypothetical protein
MATYSVGDGVRVSAVFTDIHGNAADPTVAAFKVRDPNGAVTSPSLTRVQTGVYYSDIVLTKSGTWSYRWEGTGAVVAAKEGSLDVCPSAFS